MNLKKLTLTFFCLFPFNLIAAEYSFGVVPQFEARKLYSIWLPILKVLKQKTGHDFKMHGTESIRQFETEFTLGSYDFAYMNPWHSLLAFEKQGYVPLVKDGARKLKGILVTHKDSAIKNISQLEGKKVAFPSPNALGASLLVRAELMQKGISIKPVYLGTHTAVYLDTALKLVSGGGGVLATFSNQKFQVQDVLNIIYETQSIAPHPVSVHPRVSKEVINQVKQAFLEMSNEPEYQKLLAHIPMKKAVVARQEDYSPLKKMGLEHFYVKD